MSTYRRRSRSSLFVSSVGNDRSDFVNSFISVTPTLTSPVLVFITGPWPSTKSPLSKSGSRLNNGRLFWTNKQLQLPALVLNNHKGDFAKLADGLNAPHHTYLLIFWVSKLIFDLLQRVRALRLGRIGLNAFSVRS